ncbi:hypothetical protein [Glycomyces harbinensis]|uniref:Uncharacterized protein n=1 Tax=Glycomyces harbinensis TaxID=58114 RepID=A0A1G6V9D3_9ACTN|nr:hypothetical protein [Glycomyces harbinensis]SDD49627.1 hypothetical protein SAMN05216270_104261 [Glycomyces harbinensis]
MPKFPDFKSMIESPPPSGDAIKEMVAGFSEPLQMRYVRFHYDEFFNARYPTGSVIQNPNDTWTFDFDTHMTGAEDEELRSMCWAAATNFIVDVLVRVEALLDKDEDALSALAHDLRQLAKSYDGAVTDAKLGIVQERFESWHGGAGAAVRENYSDHFTRSAQSHTEMANALANAAELDALVVMKLRHHLDGLVRGAGAAIDNGSGQGTGLEPIMGWLTVIGIIASSPGGPAAMSATAWVAGAINKGLTELALEETDQPTMDSADPDELRSQVLAAFDRVEEVVRKDREALAGDLVLVFEEYAALVAGGDPAQSSRVIPNPNGVDGIAL